MLFHGFPYTLLEGVYDEGCDGSVALCDVGFNLDVEEGPAAIQGTIINDDIMVQLI